MTKQPSPSRRRVRAFTLTLAVALAAPACDTVEKPDPSQYYKPAAAEQLPDAPADKAVRIAWFGHSLVQRPAERAGEIPIDLPKLVYDLHAAALKDGRTTIPQRPPFAFTLLGRHLGHHLDGPGDAAARLAELKDAGVTHVVGIGFMHMLGEKMFTQPTLALWARRIGLDRYDSPRLHTEHVYRLMGLMREALPNATWVSYVGPALSMNKKPQPAIDGRYACIEETAKKAGVAALSAWVGRAFRAAEAGARDAPALTIKLQAPDGLHLTAQGAVLAASVLYERIYKVNPVDLTVPEPYFSALGANADVRLQTASYLQKIAHSTWIRYSPDCGEKLPEDEAAASLLSPTR